jgi:four helix bundle protein
MAKGRPAAKTFRELVVWQKAHEFVLAVYAFTARFPKSETYGLSLQMRKAAVSIAANIAEGFRRHGKADKVRFLNTSESSLEESRYYLILSEDLSYGETGQLQESAEEISRLLSAYSKAIRGSSSDS